MLCLISCDLLKKKKKYCDIAKLSRDWNKRSLQLTEGAKGEPQYREGSLRFYSIFLDISLLRIFFLPRLSALNTLSNNTATTSNGIKNTNTYVNGCTEYSATESCITQTMQPQQDIDIVMMQVKTRTGDPFLKAGLVLNQS